MDLFVGGSSIAGLPDVVIAPAQGSQFALGDALARRLDDLPRGVSLSNNLSYRSAMIDLQPLPARNVKPMRVEASLSQPLGDLTAFRIYQKSKLPGVCVLLGN